MKKKQKYRIWLKECPSFKSWGEMVPAIPGGWFIMQGSRINEFIYDRNPDSSDRRIRYYERKSDVVRWMSEMRRLGYGCKCDPSFTVTEVF